MSAIQVPSEDVVPDTRKEILRVDDLRKEFGGVKALQGVNLTLRKGEVHALVGENGAGKSTLIKILTGVYSLDGGNIILNGNQYIPTNPKAAKSLGIQVVHQEFNLLTHLSVAENICFEAFPRSRFGLLDRSEMNQRARKAMDVVGLKEIEVSEKISRLGIAHRQLVEIARALESRSEILILDEPTATLTDRETEKLFQIIHRIKSQGVTIVFVSHHLNEVFEICDRVTVFRSGKSIITENICETTPEQVVSHMVGRNLEMQMSLDVGSENTGEKVLSVRNFRVPQSPHEKGVSFDVCHGEIVGIAGLVGSGRTELLKSIFAAQEIRSGQLFKNGQEVVFRKPGDAIAEGIGFVTEDRKDEGLILNMPISENISLTSVDKISGSGLINFAKERKLASDSAKTLKIKLGKLKDSVSSLSGGNQQKVVLAKWLARKPEVLLLDEPTRGVDVGAKAEIYSILRELAGDGMALLVVSSELPELMTLCDRILVLSNHEIVGEVKRQEFSQERILQLAYKNL